MLWGVFEVLVDKIVKCFKHDGIRMLNIHFQLVNYLTFLIVFLYWVCYQPPQLLAPLVKMGSKAYPKIVFVVN